MENSHGNWVKPPRSLHDRGDRRRDDRAVEGHQAGRQHQARRGPGHARTGTRSRRRRTRAWWRSSSWKRTTRRGARIPVSPRGGGRTSGRQPRRRAATQQESLATLGAEPQEPPCDGVTDGKLPAPRLRRGPQRGLEPEPRHREADQPGQPGRRQLRPGGPGALPARVRRPRPHRRPADGGGAASR